MYKSLIVTIGFLAASLGGCPQDTVEDPIKLYQGTCAEQKAVRFSNICNNLPSNEKNRLLTDIVGDKCSGENDPEDLWYCAPDGKGGYRMVVVEPPFSSLL